MAESGPRSAELCVKFRPYQPTLGQIWPVPGRIMSDAERHREPSIWRAKSGGHVCRHGSTFGPNRLTEGHILLDFGRLWLVLAEIAADLVHIGPSLAQAGPTLIRLRSILSDFGRFRSNLESRQILDRLQPNLARNQRLGLSSTDLGRSLPEFGHNCPELEHVLPTWTKFGWIQAEFGLQAPTPVKFG